MVDRERRKRIIDPAVVAVLEDGYQRQRRREMTPEQRKRAVQNAQRQRTTLELKPEIVEMIRLIAEFEECSPAGIVNLFVMEGVEQYIQGEIILDGRRRASRAPRWGWVVVLEDEDLDGLTKALRQFLNVGKK
jgi:hypothetical protein